MEEKLSRRGKVWQAEKLGFQGTTTRVVQWPASGLRSGRARRAWSKVRALELSAVG